jgi:tetratricopeptide (TPR) repeat protein/membrane protease YdiL (CAAX protease family)
MSTNSDHPSLPASPLDGVEALSRPSDSAAAEAAEQGSIAINLVSLDGPSADDHPPEAASIPAPTALPATRRLPTPGLGGAVGWCLLLALYALLATIPAYGLLKLVWPDKSEPVLLFISGSAATFLAAIHLVSKRVGSQRRRCLAIRRIRLLHLVLVLLMAPPLFLLVAETINCATQVLDPERGQAIHGEHALRQAQARLARASPWSDWTEKMYREMAAQPWWLILLAGCVLPAVGEEAFCRGFLGRALVARYGVVIGIAVTSLLFGLLHVEPVHVCAATVGGVALHIVYLTTRTYWAPVLLHALNNSLVFAALRLSEDGRTDVTGQYADRHLPAVLVSVAAAALLALIFLLYRTRTRWVLADGQVWSPGYLSAEMPPTEQAATARRSSPGPAATWTTVVVYFVFVMVAVVEIDPGTPHTAWSYNERGNQRLERGEVDAAISDYTEAIRLDADYSWAYANRGLAFFKKERYAQAIPDLDQAIRLDPSQADAYLHRGLAHHQLGHHDLAITDYTQVLRLQPDDVQTRHNRARLYMVKGQLEQAIADFTVLLTHEPANAEAYRERGHMYLLKDRRQEAFDDLTAAIRLEPNSAAAYYLRSFARQSQGDPAGAEADRREAERIDPGIAEEFR